MDNNWELFASLLQSALRKLHPTTLNLGNLGSFTALFILEEINTDHLEILESVGGVPYESPFGNYFGSKVNKKLVVFPKLTRLTTENSCLPHFLDFLTHIKATNLKYLKIKVPLQLRADWSEDKFSLPGTFMECMVASIKIHHPGRKRVGRICCFRIWDLCD